MNEFLALLRKQLAEDVAALPALREPGALGRRRLERCVNIADLRAMARRSVPRVVFDFVDGAAADEVTAQRNQADFALYGLQPRVLSGITSVSLATTVLGRPVALPLLGAPTGLTGLTHHEGELGVARAVHAAGSLYVLSSVGSYSVEEVAQGTDGPMWFQVYPWRDRGLVRDVIERARVAGFRALVLTVDVPRAGARERDARNGFGIPPRVTARALAEGLLRPRWATNFVRRPRMSIANAAGHGGVGDPVSLTSYVNQQFDPSVDWDYLAWIRGLWSGPLMVKGILRPEDAAQAVRLGVEAIGVSNHGGRQLDHAPSSIRALPAVLDAVGDQAEVLLDGGVRRGSDAVVALALGARACLIGRPLVYGLAAAGQAGAAHAIAILAREMELCMTLLGCRDVAELDQSWLTPAGEAVNPDQRSPA